MNFREIPRNAAHLLRPARLLKVFLLVCLAWVAAGCQQPGHHPTGGPRAASHQDTAEPGRQSALAVPATADPQEIQTLLQRAEDALLAGRLLSPASSSALLLYDRVLNLDPGNDAARRGIEQIAQHFIDEALDAAEQRRFEQARAMLGQARLADPEHPGMAAAEEQITLLSSAKRQVLKLDGKRLESRDAALLETLRHAGTLARRPGCRAIVHARSDGEGRWIYQQMSAAAGEGPERIRANLQISWPPAVEVLCFTTRPAP